MEYKPLYTLTVQWTKSESKWNSVMFVNVGYTLVWCRSWLLLIICSVTHKHTYASLSTDPPAFPENKSVPKTFSYI